MSYLVSRIPQPGFTPLVQPGDAGLRWRGFGVLSLAAGQSHTLRAEAKETALVLLKGAALIRGPGFSHAVGPREDFFRDKPWTVLLPARCECRIEATADSQIAVCQAPSERTGTACLIPPEKVKDLTIGKGSFQRRALIMVDESVPADYLFIGEAFVPPGNWASFPPHRHERDELPDEVEMEEVYYFRFDRPEGFGIQKLYTDDRSIDETLTVREHDTVLIPRGYHPVAAAPGYNMYYLWIMAGKARKFLSRIDPDHRWILQS